MRRFFRGLSLSSRSSLDDVAIKYADHLFRYSVWSGDISIQGQRSLASSSRFTIGLVSKDRELPVLAKRGTLIADTLVISHGGHGKFHEMKLLSASSSHLSPQVQMGSSYDGGGTYQSLTPPPPPEDFLHFVSSRAGIRCPDIVELGRWILDSEKLLQQGLVYYLPSYVIRDETSVMALKSEGRSWQREKISEATRGLVSLLARNRQAVGLASIDPVNSSLVRHILSIDLPFVDGVSLKDFSSITLDAYSSYESFRNLLRHEFLELDSALDSDGSRRAVTRISTDIEGGLLEFRSEMTAIKKRRAFEVSGATFGATTASLMAVHGPALMKAPMVGLAGVGVLGVIKAIADGNVSLGKLEDGPWYYVWLLGKNSR